VEHRIGLIRGIFLVTITFIGSGVMAIPAMTASLAGERAIYAWLVLAISSLPLGLVFARLGQRFPSQGGVSEYLSLALNSPRSKAIGQRLAAYLFLIAVITGAAPAVGIASANLGRALELAPQWYPALTLLTVLLIMLLVYLGIRFSSGVQMAVVLVFVLLLALLWIKGAPDELFLPPLSGPSDLFSKSMIAAFGAGMWAFIGFEALSHLSQDFKNPHRDLPIATIVGMLIATLFYVATLILVLGHHAYGNELSDTTSLPLLYNKLYGAGGRQIVGVVGYLAGFAVVVVYFTSFTRLTQYLALHGQAPARLGDTNRFNTPYWGLWLISLTTLLSLTIKYALDIHFVALITFTNAVFMTIYSLAMLSAIKLLSGVWRVLAVLGLLVCLSFIAAMISLLQDIIST